MSSFFTKEELFNIGFASVGNNVFISKKASFYSANCISIGSNVRIDDFCVLSGNISIGDYVHISVGTLMFGGESFIRIGSHTSISSRCGIYSVSDDFSGNYMVGSMESDILRNVIKKEVAIGDYVAIGTGSTILPGSIIPDGVAIGAMSLVKKPLEEWTIYCGIPCVKIRKREKRMVFLHEN